MYVRRMWLAFSHHHTDRTARRHQRRRSQRPVRHPLPRLYPLLPFTGTWLAASPPWLLTCSTQQRKAACNRKSKVKLMKGVELLELPHGKEVRRIGPSCLLRRRCCTLST